MQLTHRVAPDGIKPMDIESEDSEECRVYIVRRPDQRVWLDKANAGDEAARLCLWAASNLKQAISQGRSVNCTCCEAPFDSGDVPQAFIVLIPVKREPAKARAHAMGVCAVCSKQDDKWLVDQGPKREGAFRRQAPSKPDKIH